MGLTHVAVKLRNLTSTDTFTGTFLVDTGAWHSMVPACELKRLGIKPTGKKTYELASGELGEFEVGYAELTFMDEVILSPVIFGPHDAEPLLGVTALELAGYIVDPIHQTIKKLDVFPLKHVA